jgi:hypothetical protein
VRAIKVAGCVATPDRVDASRSAVFERPKGPLDFGEIDTMGSACSLDGASARPLRASTCLKHEPRHHCWAGTIGLREGVSGLSRA